MTVETLPATAMQQSATVKQKPSQIDATLMQRASPRTITAEEWDKAKLMRMAGSGWREIAELLQINENTLKCRAHRERLPTLTATVKAEVAAMPGKRIASSLAETSQRVRDLLAVDAESTALRLEQYQPDNLRDEWQREQIAGSLVKRAAATFDWTQSQSQLVLNVGIMSQLPDSDQAQSIEPLDV
jgi:hypothetical protein